ncbi:unnamed protein product [Adineta steineri]|uniref:Kinesin light chain n=1 Tax=Adineta steineri TaxID=433720 RepID=A0A819Q037_9BILA|nr:unnamed protein product [Adineta steineri]
MLPSTRVPYTRTIRNFRLVWLDKTSGNVNDTGCMNTIVQFREVIDDIQTYTDVDECVAFINDIRDEKIFLISSEALSQIIVPIIHNKTQVSDIYIFCGNKTEHEQWIQQWLKVKGVFTNISSICELLSQAAEDCDQNSISMSFVETIDNTSNINRNELDQSFIYTQILKEILLTIDFEEDYYNDFLLFCREYFVNNNIELRNVDKIEREYHEHKPVWWYTYNCFLYSMSNKSLRTIEIDIIIKLGFFIRDLHQHIADLHSEQYSDHHHSETFTVYRGQGLSLTDFDQLVEKRGGLLSFNSFLSTSEDRNVSLAFARRSIQASDLIGILFIMKTDPSKSSTPFAKIHDQVELTLTSNNNPQLCALMERIRKETMSDYKGWYRLGVLLVKLDQYDKAEQLYDLLLTKVTETREEAYLNHMIGIIKNNQGKYEEAIHRYEKSIEINQKMLSPDVYTLAASYNDLGSVYSSMNDYSKAHSYYKKALHINRETLPPDHPDLATCYNNIGGIYESMGEHNKAFRNYKRALEIYQRTRTPNHPTLADCYNNIGSVYENLGKYSKALSFHERALEIHQRTLPPDHHDLACSIGQIGMVCSHMGDRSKAIECCERALKIVEHSLPSNHPDIEIYKKILNM